MAAAPLACRRAECVLMAANRSEVQGLSLAVVSLTQEAGELLQQLAAQHGGGRLAVSLRMPAEGAVDWSSLALWLIATGTVAAGGLWAGHGHLAALGRDSSTPTRKAGASEVPSVTISSRAAVGFVVLASAMLLTLFFFLDKWLAYVLVRHLAAASPRPHAGRTAGRRVAAAAVAAPHTPASPPRARRSRCLRLARGRLAA